MSGPPAPTLLEAARKHWRDFLPAWIFPILFLYGGLLADHLGHPLLFFILVAAPLFFWSGNRASKPWTAKQITYWQGVFWGMLVPFSVWTMAVFSRIVYLDR